MGTSDLKPGLGRLEICKIAYIKVSCQLQEHVKLRAYNYTNPTGVIEEKVNFLSKNKTVMTVFHHKKYLAMKACCSEN